MTISKDDPKHVATTCLLSWTRGDFDTVRALLDDNVVFTGALGATKGADAYVNGVRGFSKLVLSVEVRQVIAEGGDVCVIYDLVTNTPAGALPTVGWYRIRDGKITSVQAFFDPRPLLPHIGPPPAR